MSKKKDTLKDLDEFLKQQAATIVAPTQLSDTIQQPQQLQAEISASKILDDLKAFSEKEGAAFRKKFYDLIIQSIEAQKNSSPEDKMLINTALYLKSGSNWKDVIREYWSGR